MKKLKGKLHEREKRRRRIRSRIKGTSKKPRLAFFRSNKQVYAQIIDDDKKKTVIGISSLKYDDKGSVKKAEKMGKEIAKKAAEKKIKEVVFDRGGFMYTGSVKAFADSARGGGLKF